MRVSMARIFAALALASAGALPAITSVSATCLT